HIFIESPVRFTQHIRIAFTQFITQQRQTYSSHRCITRRPGFPGGYIRRMPVYTEWRSVSECITHCVSHLFRISAENFRHDCRCGNFYEKDMIVRGMVKAVGEGERSEERRVGKECSSR